MTFENPTLLIVEDDDNDFVFLERALEMEKFEGRVERASDGVEAIEYLAGENAFANRDKHPLPDLIVLDLKMPRKGGFEVLSWLRERTEFQPLPVVILSSSDEPGDVEKAYDLGVNGYLVKPSSFLSYPEVVRTLRQFLLNGNSQNSAKRNSSTNRSALNTRQIV